MCERDFQRRIHQLQADLDNAMDDGDKERIEELEHRIRLIRRKMRIFQD